MKRMTVRRMLRQRMSNERHAIELLDRYGDNEHERKNHETDIKQIESILKFMNDDLD